MQTESTPNIFKVLKEIKSIGYIEPKNNAIVLCYKKINHAFAELFKNSPIDSSTAIQCMTHLKEICIKNPVFFSLFPKTIMDLHDWAMEGNDLTKTQADIQLLHFFTYESPSSVKDKKALLEKIRTMPRLNEKFFLLSSVLYKLSNHYEQNHQYKEDPNKSVLFSLKDALNIIPPLTRKVSSCEKLNFLSCAEIIQRHEPALYEEEWTKRFTPKAQQKYTVPSIKDASTVFTRKSCFVSPFSASYEWDRN